jgi:hypothetical protein
MSRITGVIVALAASAAVLTGSTSGAAPPPAAAAAADLPRELEGGVEVTLADGDLLRVTTARSYRTVWSERRDATTGTWGPRTVVLERKNLFCGASTPARTLSRTGLPTFAPPCTTARSSTYELPYRFDLFGRLKGYTVQIRERDGEWTARRSRR